MSEKVIERVEFIGGPVDGHVAPFAGPSEKFVAVMTNAKINDKKNLTLIFRMLFFQARVYPSVMAIYQLQRRDTVFVYVYLLSCSESKLNLNLKSITV